VIDKEARQASKLPECSMLSEICEGLPRFCTNNFEASYISETTWTQATCGKRESQEEAVKLAFDLLVTISFESL
jgi:hypothetical protein